MPDVHDAAFSLWLGLTTEEKEELLGELVEETYGGKASVFSSSCFPFKTGGPPARHSCLLSQ
jgi:hypothetical protein